jgi:hypothetical protein
MVLGKDFNFLLAAEGDAEPFRRAAAAFKATLDNDLEVLYRRKDGSACCDHAPADAFADRPVLKKPFDIQN